MKTEKTEKLLLNAQAIMQQVHGKLKHDDACAVNGSFKKARCDCTRADLLQAIDQWLKQFKGIQ